MNQKSLFPKKVWNSPEKEVCQRVFQSFKYYCPKKAVVVEQKGAAAASTESNEKRPIAPLFANIFGHMIR